MREVRDISEASYSSLLSSVRYFVEELSSNQIIEAMSVLYDHNANTSKKHKAIIIVKDSND